ncbi:MAG: sulfite exporter TauE/SafE family protein [Methylococcales bacterium]|nr:sulfite exporter TauE/SafE family protein [Methylococcales bacterium]
MTTRSLTMTLIGMQCRDCGKHIEHAMQALPGVDQVQVDYAQESISLRYDSARLNTQTIIQALQQAGYDGQPIATTQATPRLKRVFFSLLAILAVIALFNLKRWLPGDFSSTALNPGMHYGLLFLVGFLTSFHCIGMCGSFVVSYTLADARLGRSPWRNHIGYALGKMLSYSGLGAAFGALGAFITFTASLQAAVSLLAGSFLILYGLSFFPIFNRLRRLHLKLPQTLSKRLTRVRHHNRHAFTIGLLNGLMIACGPLQAFYIMAAETGDPWQGAKLLAAFAAGTLPVMLIFGSLTTLIGAQALRHFSKISGLIIVILGVIMINRGLVIAGSQINFSELSYQLQHRLTASFSTAVQRANGQQRDYQVVYMEVFANRYQPAQFYIQADIPVKWILDVHALSTCNQELRMPWLNQQWHLHEGLQKIEFTPTDTQKILKFSCSMGMMQGRFIVQ